MHRVSENEVIAMQNVERHDDLAVRAQLHPTIELPVEFVKRESSAFHNSRTTQKVSHMVRPHGICA